MSRQRRMGEDMGGGSTSQLDLLWIILVSFFMIVFSLMTQQMQTTAQEQQVKDIEKVLQEDPDALRGSPAWMTYTLDHELHGMRVGAATIAGDAFGVFAKEFHFIIRYNYEEEEPTWWAEMKEKHRYRPSKVQLPSEEEAKSPVFNIRFHGDLPRDHVIAKRTREQFKHTVYQVRNEQFVVGGQVFTPQQLEGILSQTHGLYTYLREGDEPDPPWLQRLWRKYYIQNFDLFRNRLQK